MFTIIIMHEVGLLPQFKMGKENVLVVESIHDTIKNTQFSNPSTRGTGKLSTRKEEHGKLSIGMMSTRKISTGKLSTKKRKR